MMVGGSGGVLTATLGPVPHRSEILFEPLMLPADPGQHRMSRRQMMTRACPHVMKAPLPMRI
jgi:hypothetical protein